MSGALGRFVITAALALAATPVGAAPSGLPAEDPVVARLVPETASAAPGTTLWLDLHLDIAPGWHTYWRNPGDSGLPTELHWKLPDGFTAGDIAWPVPEQFVVGAIGNYGYGGATDLLVPLAVPATAPPGSSAHLEADATWLVCSDICIPGEAKLALDLPVAAAPATPDRVVAAQFAAARERLPKPAGFAVHFAATERAVRLFVPAEAPPAASPVSAAFFPLDPNVLDAAAEPRQEQDADGLQLVLQRAIGPNAVLSDALNGVLTVRDAAGAEHAYTIRAARIAVVPAGAAASLVEWWQALLLAMLGGLALNLMPCVFPVLSLKVIGLTVALHRAERLEHGLAYAAGVILSFALLGGVLLALRQGGAAIGWGFQLQSPVVVGLLAYLLFAMGLSLSGVAEFGLGLGGIGARFAGRGGLAGAFATGVLATIVATPCTAPFMGTALGFAVVAPAPVALLVFVALGCGLALPLALVSAIPGLARLLPRPGVWMLWFKQALAFPLYATVAWLLWVLIQEVGAGGALMALFGLVVVAFAMWIYGATRAAGAAGRRLGAALAGAGAAAALVLATMLTPASALSSTVAASDGLGYERFSAAKLASLAAEHRPAFVNLTAAWCITCLVNERTALDSAAVRRAFAERGIVALKGDWTRQDADITAFLQRFGRSGVPLYLLYGKDGSASVLPQILTESGVLDALNRI